MKGFFKKILSITLGIVTLSMAFSCFGKDNGNNNSTSSANTSSNSSQVSNSSSGGEQSGALDANEIKYDSPSNLETYYNYIEVYDDKGRVCRIGDPYILKYNGTYYLYTSCTGHMLKIGIPCWTSTNLVDWTFRSWIWGDGETDYGTDSLCYNAYAPEIIYYKGWFYMCESPNGTGHYIFKSKTPDGKFEVCSDNLGLGIDGHFYVDSNGELYLLSANDGIKYTKLKIDNGTFYKEGVTLKVKGPYLSSWIEGPEVIERAGYSYLLYTGNHVNSAGYRMAYNYIKSGSGSVFSDLQVPQDCILLLNTGDDTPYNKKGYNSNNDYTNVDTYRGLGHGCAVYGPNLDSLYLGYHNQGRYDHTGGNATSFDRRFNLTQMYTNKSYLTTNGICITDTPKPFGADYETSTLVSQGGMQLTSQETKSVYTAEINFKLNGDNANIIVGYKDVNNYSEIVLQGANLSVNRYIDGVKSTLATNQSLLLSENQADNFHSIKVVNGYSKSTVYYDNNLVADIDSPLSTGGKIGVKDTQNGYVSFSNDAYGTSDFESIKNLGSTFPAYSYLKGENRGYSIKDATIKADGVRQGEKESTVNLDNAVATKLNQGDWVKYAINANKVGEYGFNVEVTQASKNAELQLIVDETYIYNAQIKNGNFGKESYIYINAGNFTISSKGVHSLKVKVVSGSVDMRNIFIQADAEKVTLQEDLNSTFTNGKKVLGDVTFKNGLVTNAEQVKTVYYVGNKGVANFNFSMDVTLISGNAGMLFRAKNFSYSGNLATIQDAMQGYLLDISSNCVRIYKFTTIYNREELTNYYGDFSGTNNFRIMIRQNYIRVYLNGTQIIAYVDTATYMDGYCGIYTENASAKYQNLVYAPL